MLVSQLAADQCLRLLWLAAGFEFVPQHRVFMIGVRRVRSEFAGSFLECLEQEPLVSTSMVFVLGSCCNMLRLYELLCVCGWCVSISEASLI